MATALIGLGSNLGSREHYLEEALKRLQGLPETRLLQVSRWHETIPVGGPCQGMFLNGAAQIQTRLLPQPLLLCLKEIERALGRPEKRIPCGPRVMDLDLLAYDDLTLETAKLTLPHPRMHERPFVLLPLLEIAPGWIHPILGKSIEALLETCAHANRQAPG